MAVRREEATELAGLDGLDLRPTAPVKQLPKDRRTKAQPAEATEAVSAGAADGDVLPPAGSSTGKALHGIGRTETVFPAPPPLRHHGPARIIALCNQKGGVGKTTTSINLAASLAEYGRKVLAVDFDPQGALSVGLGAAVHDGPTVYELLLGHERDAAQVIRPTSIPNLDVMPANIDLSAAEVHLVTEVGREHILARVLRQVADRYDVILIDCQPSLGLLTVNALTAAHGVIIPLESEYFALRGVALLIDTIDKVRDRLNPAIKLDGILTTMYDPRTLHSREVLDRVVEAFGDTVLDTLIHRTVKFPDASVAAEPITSFAPQHQGAEAYRRLARELVARGAVA